MICNAPKPGFTLAELLIALALLGIIAAFTIPKVLQSSATQETNAKLRETVATLENAWINVRSQNQIIYGQWLYESIVPSLNVVASATTAPSFGSGPFVGMPTHPCVEIPLQSGWVQFPNGVVVTGLREGGVMDNLPALDPSHETGNNYVLCIDVNGNASPNLPGQDVFLGNFNQYGGIVASPTTETAALKSFHWGGTGSWPTSAIWDSAGTPVDTPSYTNVGLETYTPCALVGCRLRQ